MLLLASTMQGESDLGLVGLDIPDSQHGVQVVVEHFQSLNSCFEAEVARIVAS